ncbi:hypothetical protein [Azospirillum thermophilum]|uniref:Uncharacterized protein n=1 Tax=Azospirillum thermophilum TaxID=2202148 RepID=A0A2S2CQW9_9PROT|nr:hypothetical protein [Azospirillum thermophilum]AWK86760.1 hypothetical protein DEW08_11375 [Azospirillum thermophilum]
MVACTVMAGEAAARGGSGGHSFGSGHSSSTYTPHSSSHGDHSVSGYTRKDGTYVAPHHQTNPNGTKLDNYSTKGNVNPYTGKPGTVDPYK